MVYPDGQEELSQCGHFADKGEGVNFSRFYADVVYGQFFYKIVQYDIKELFINCVTYSLISNQLCLTHSIKVC